MARVALDAREVILPWLVARGLVLVGFVLATLVADRYIVGGTTPQLHEGLVAWDGTFYRDIANVGYGGLPLEALRFFPLFPLLGRALGFGQATVALIVIANAAAFGFSIVMRRVALLETGDEVIARRAVWLSALFPSAFVLVFAYAEALFLVLAAGCFLAFRRDRWGWAAGLAFLAALTRPMGLALALPLVIAAAPVVLGRSPGALRSASTRVGAGVAPLAAVAGTAVYCAWVRASFGDALLPFTVQNDLRGEANPIVRLGRGLADLVGPERFGDGLHIPFAVAFLVLLVVCFRRWPVVYGAYATAVLLAALSADNLNSLERYGLNAFPLVLALAGWINRDRIERVVFVVCGAGLSSLAALTWLSVYVP